MQGKRPGASALLLLSLLGLTGCKLLGYAETRAPRIIAVENSKPDVRVLGASRFLFDDLGGLNTDTLETNGFPWKVVVTAMLMEQAQRTKTVPVRESVAGVLQQYGWITPTGVDNWPSGPAPAFDKPVGIVSGELKRSAPTIRLEVANVGCAACHAGMSYDVKGEPTGRVWLGSPNSSRYLDGFTSDIIAALRYVRGHTDEFLATVQKIFPEVHPDEIATIRRYVLPQIVKRLEDIDAGKELFFQFEQGGAGLTNAVATLKLRLNVKPSLVSNHEYGYTSIPDLYGRRLRSSVLYDGAYALRADARFVERREGDFDRRDHERLASIVAFFIVPTMGIKPNDSEKQARRVSEILEWVLDYKPQPFPGAIDRDKALAGSRLYAAQCASCHGSYTPGIDQLRLVSYPNRTVPQEDMNTDAERWRAITVDMVKVIDTTAVGDKVNAGAARGYVAPILGGLWASSPYLHNGSVPTLWHLMHPEARPKKFYVGGHKVDLVRVGIAGEIDAEGVYRYPADYRPWSTPVMIDTGTPGRHNGGHEKEMARLSETDKEALIEFLKLL